MTPTNPIPKSGWVATPSDLRIYAYGFTSDSIFCRVLCMCVRTFCSRTCIFTVHVHCYNATFQPPMVQHQQRSAVIYPYRKLLYAIEQRKIEASLIHPTKRSYAEIDA